MLSRPSSGKARRDSGSLIAKRSIKIRDCKTAISLEEAFLSALKEIAALRQVRVSKLVEAIDKDRNQINLSSAVRLFVLDFYRQALRPRRPNRSLWQFRHLPP